MSAVTPLAPVRKRHLAAVPDVQPATAQPAASQFDRIEHDIALMQAQLEALMALVRHLRTGGVR